MCFEGEHCDGVVCCKMIYLLIIGYMKMKSMKDLINRVTECSRSDNTDQLDLTPANLLVLSKRLFKKKN